MMRWKPLWSACTVIGLVVPAAGSAEQLAKHGSYAGKIVWFEKGTIMPVEKDYFFKEAPQQGLFLNAAEADSCTLRYLCAAARAWCKTTSFLSAAIASRRIRKVTRPY